MSACSTPEPPGIRHALYIEELREFFATSGLPCGSPEDIYAVTERLHSSENFFADLSSLMRSIVLREGGAVPCAELLEILALSIGGPQMELAPQDFQQPLRLLLAFVSEILRRPWNQPPAEHGPVLPFHSDAATTTPAPAEPAATTIVQSREEELPAITVRDGLSTPEQDLPSTPPRARALSPQAVAAALPPAPAARPSRRSKPPYWIFLAAAAAFGLLVLLGIKLLHPAPPSVASHPAPPLTTPVLSSPDTAQLANVSAEGAPTGAVTPLAKPSADGPPLITQPAPVQRIRTAAEPDDDIAPPTVRNAPGWPPAKPAAAPQTATSAPDATAPSVSSSAPSAAPSSAPVFVPIDPRTPLESSASTGGTSTLQQAYRDPDGSIVGDPLPVRALRGRYFSVSSGVMAANLVSDPEPGYPALARLAHIQGQVILQAVISRDGTVAATRVLSGPRLLRGAAVNAVRRWRYRPYLTDGHPVDVATIVTVGFHNSD